MVGTIDTSAVVDEVCIDTATAQGITNTSSLRHAKVRALANDVCLQFCAVHTNKVIARVADVQMAFASVLNIGSYSAEPHQLNRRF